MMGRSSRSQADASRTRIVEAASSLFRANGIGAVGISDVMKAAGMTQGGFYKHFPSKAALAAEACTFAFTKAAENWRRVAQDAESRGADATDAILAYYLAPKPPEMTCPMIALAPDAVSPRPEDPVHRAYTAGVTTLFETFTQIAGATSTASARLRLLFAAMVGSNLLNRSGFAVCAAALAQSGGAESTHRATSFRP